MRFNTIICPNCGQSLTASEYAPNLVTCPRCLAVIDNPGPAVADVPIPVIPIERQIKFDSVGSRIALYILTGLVTLGVAMALIGVGPQLGGVPLMLVLVAAGVGVYAVHAMRFRDDTRFELAQRRQKHSDLVPPQPNAQKIISYERQERVPAISGGLQLFLGFLYVLGIVILSLKLMSFRLGAELAILPAVVLICFWQTRGFALGIVIGMLLCLFLPIGLCFIRF
jgi:hypothetical protein